jgi:hypothetical protein
LPRLLRGPKEDAKSTEQKSAADALKPPPKRPRSPKAPISGVKEKSPLAQNAAKSLAAPKSPGNPNKRVEPKPVEVLADAGWFASLEAA